VVSSLWLAFLLAFILTVILAFGATFVAGQAIQVRGGDLHGVEHNASFFSVEAVVQQVLADLVDGVLDGGGVFKDGKVKGSGWIGCGDADVNLDQAAAVVETAKLSITQGGRSTTIPTYFYVLATFAGKT
jgi:hypothetical protein